MASEAIDLIVADNKSLRLEVSMLQEKLRCFDDVKKSSALIQRLTANQELLSKKIDQFCASAGHGRSAGNKSVRDIINEAVAGVRAELDSINRIVSGAALAHRDLSQSIADYCEYFENEIRLLHEQSRFVKKREIDIMDTEGSLNGLDWSMVLTQVKGENSKFEREVEELMAEIEKKRKNVSMKIANNSLKVANRYEDQTQPQPLKLNQPKRNMDIPELFKETSKITALNTAEINPLNEEAVQSQRRKSFVTNGEEYFELELTENSCLGLPGHKTRIPRDSEVPEPVKKLIFEEDKQAEYSTYELKDGMTKNSHVPPRSNLRVRKNNSQESSFLNRNYSINNSGINESSASRRKRRESNVVIRLRSNSQQNDSRLERENFMNSPLSEQKPSDKKTHQTQTTIREPMRQILQNTNMVYKRSSIFDALLAKKTGISSRLPLGQESNRNPMTNTFHGGLLSAADRFVPGAPFTHHIEIGGDRSIRTSTHRARQ